MLPEHLRSPITSSAFTTTLANEIICAIGSVPATGLTWSAGAGYVIDSTGFPTGTYCGAEHQIVSSVQTGVTATIVENDTIGGISVATFKAAPSAGGLYYSVPDCRVAPFGPNASRLVNGTKIYDVQTSSNPAIAPTDSRVSKPVASGTYPQNSRTPGVNGPGN